MSATAEETNVEQAPATASKIKPEDIHMPSSSYWPIVLAFGFFCLVGGLAINIVVTLIGVVIALVAVIGWVIEPVHGEEEHS